jgi:predicted nucleic acid binding AN1-type Zn finger protein
MSLNRCEFVLDKDKVCNKKTRLGLSYCNYCEKHYCSFHYQLELHNCSILDDMKKQGKDLLEKRLLSGKADFRKLQKI